MVELTLPKNSQIREGKTWTKPEGASNLREYRIYRWSPDDDDRYQVPGTYSYRPEVVDGVRRVDLPVTVGDVVMLNSAAYHSVADSSERLAFGSFVSVFDDGRLRLWS